jgi:transcriptional regulator with XRE-family HTH domain
MGTPADWIRQLREQRGFTREQVEELTREFSTRTCNERNWIRHGRLAHIERGEAVPDIYAVQSFAEIYQVNYERILQGFGIDTPANHHLPGQSVGIPTNGDQIEVQKSRRFGEVFLQRIRPEQTRLVTDPVENTEVLRAILGLEFDALHTRIGLIGSKDDSMGPYVPPGSAVKIDTRDKTVVMSAWRDLIERPIYFVWHEEGYSCCWCDQRDHKLILLPHPVSHRSAIQLRTGQATIIGRVTHVWSPLIRTAAE